MLHRKAQYLIIVSLWGNSYFLTFLSSLLQGLFLKYIGLEEGFSLANMSVLLAHSREWENNSHCMKSSTQHLEFSFIIDFIFGIFTILVEK